MLVSSNGSYWTSWSIRISLVNVSPGSRSWRPRSGWLNASGAELTGCTLIPERPLGAEMCRNLRSEWIDVSPAWELI